jgi:hypothetical protein
MAMLVLPLVAEKWMAVLNGTERAAPASTVPSMMKDAGEVAGQSATSSSRKAAVVVARVSWKESPVVVGNERD